MFEMNKADELKPCPFCGGKAELDESEDEFGMHSILCSSCGTMMVFGSIFEATTKWNTRTDAPEPKSNVQDFADTIKDDPAQIIKWAKREIEEYQKLIKILEK
jgi:Lar family restriction alleviation protein